jgi:cytochrome c-type biogenesis protein
MNEHISVLLAFGAGLLSFLSPCVLPLIPSYLCVIGGAPLTAGTAENNGELKPRLVARTVSFILGFSAVFIVLSILFAATFSLMGGVSRWINWISGAVVIVLGLNIIFDFISFLNYEKRFRPSGQSAGIAGAFVTGAAFGAGWTPCVGPVLTGILLLAAAPAGGNSSGGILRAALYLSAYSAGMGLPFLLASIFFNSFLKTSKKLRPHLPLIRRISGALLVVIGVLIITGRYQALNVLTAKWQSNLPGGKASASGTAAVSDKVIAAGAAAGTAVNAEENAVSAGVLTAFNAAGLPVAAKGIDPFDFELPLLDGTVQRLSGLKGKVVFLNFWATWCGPCRMEMPSMEAVYQRLKDQGFEILAVNEGEKRDQVAPFMREYTLSFPAALDEKGNIGAAYGVQAIPATYILDRRGLIVSRMIGSIDWNEPKIIAAFETLLAE